MPYERFEKLMEQTKKMKQNQTVEAPFGQNGTSPKESEDPSEYKIETKIYVGLNDGETKEQLFKTEKYLNLLKNVCKNYHIAFSVDIEEGGYFHDNGEYTEETSLVLILIDVDRNTVREIAKDLCTFFRQESVLVTEDLVKGYFLYSK